MNVEIGKVLSNYYTDYGMGSINGSLTTKTTHFQNFQNCVIT